MILRRFASLLGSALRPLAALPIGYRSCVLCGNTVMRFIPYQGGWAFAPPLVKALEGIGSDIDHFFCPRCGAHDRERHLYLYMKRAGLLDDLADKVVVHFAPELRVAARIKDGGPRRYVACDLFPRQPDIQKEDMLSMTFNDRSVDLLIANHVLEHVPDFRKALSEVVRVLVPGGYAILQTPYSPVLTRTWDDPGICTPEARAEVYGQSDHVRIFGRDIFDEFVASGLISEVRSHAELLPEVDAKAAGVNKREPFFLFRRPI
jgi:SAM-dependent methyltransferase